MIQKMQEIRKNEKGFSLMELIIVLAIMAIIGAVLVPMFLTMSAKARLTTDVSTVKTIQRQIDIYKAETGKYPGPAAGATGAFTTAGAVDTAVINDLVTAQYLDPKDLNVSGGNHSLKLKTGGTLYSDGSNCYLNVTNKEYEKIIDDIDKDKNNGNNGWVKYVATP